MFKDYNNRMIEPEHTKGKKRKAKSVFRFPVVNKTKPVNLEDENNQPKKK